MRAGAAGEDRRGRVEGGGRRSVEDETGELAGRLGSEWLVDMAGNGSDSDQGGRQARKGRKEGGLGGVSS